MSARDRNDDDADLLRRALRDVKPLKGRAIGKSPEPAPARKKATPPRARSIPAPAEPSAAAPVLPELTVGAAIGVDVATVRKLKRGRMAPERRLDLHGHTQDQAFAVLARFLEGAQNAQARAVLVITGKSGVLRQQVPRWLNAAPNRSRILSFVSARNSDGGEGALYILLKKVKQP